MRKKYGLILMTFITILALFFSACSKANKGPQNSDPTGKDSTSPSKKGTEPVIPGTTPTNTTEVGSSPYYIYVEKGSYTLSVYSKDESGAYTKLQKAFRITIGKDSTQTPTGSFELSESKRWLELSGGNYVQYASSFGNGLSISSALYDADDVNTLVRESYISIGKKSTAGRIYAATEAAKWIYDNCPAGTKIEIVNDAPKGTTSEQPVALNTDYYFTDPTDPLRPELLNPGTINYKIYIEKGSFAIAVYAKDADGNFTRLIRSYLTASGKTAGRTPTGDFTIEKKERWHTFPKPYIGGFAQYASYFHENLMIHSPVYGLMDYQYMVPDSYEGIGTMNTAGCLRTTTEAAYWVYTYCPVGSPVEIVNGSPLEITADKPPKARTQFPWLDPTDPFRPVSDWNLLSMADVSEPGPSDTKDPEDDPNQDGNSSYVLGSFPVGGTLKLSGGMDSACLRCGPGDGFDITGYLANGTTVTVIQESDDWFEVNFLGGSAYIEKNHIELGEKYIIPYSEIIYASILPQTELPAFNAETNALLKNDLVDIRNVDDSILIELKYASDTNFVGEKLYPSHVCLLQRDAAQKLVNAQELFLKDGFRIKLYDGYRPYSVQKRLYDIIQNPLFIADPSTTASRHNRGTAVDMTLVDSEGNELSMPSPVDTFGPESHVDYPGMTEEQKANLTYMQSIMTQCGFVIYTNEWWHFSDENSMDYMVTDYDLSSIIFSDSIQ